MKRITLYLLPLVILLTAAAVVILDRTLLLNPPAYTPRGFEAFEHEDYAEAINLFAQAQKHCETDIMARRMLAMSYHNYHWNDEALEEYESVWTLYRSNAFLAMHNAGRLRRERGEFDEALECFQNALSLDQNAAALWADLAELHVARNEPQYALEAIEQAVSLEPANEAIGQLRETILGALQPPSAQQTLSSQTIQGQIPAGGGM